MTDPHRIYRLMQQALLGTEATLLPAELLDPDVVVETPFGPPGTKIHHGRQAWLDHYRDSPAASLVRYQEFHELATHRTADPEVLVLEYRLVVIAVTNGRQSTIDCAAVLRVRDGLVVGWREYQDIPAITAALAPAA